MKFELFKIEFCKTISDFAKEYDLVNFNENILTEPSLFLGELFRMSRFAEIYVSGFAGGTELNAVPLSKYERTMTGGTDVIPAYEQACKEDFDCIVVLTDGYLEFPEFEPKHTIWAMPESFGRRMEVII